MVQGQMALASEVSLAGAQGRRSSLQMAKVAGQAYRGARLKAGLGRLWALLTGRGNGLESLEQVLSEHKVRGSHHGGTRAVAIAQIRGSEGRSEDFDAQFRPLKGHTRGKWMSVALARLKGVVLPAVELAQVREAYYVLDGHHRISVARAFGQESIDAAVTVWEVEE
ncbi:MAG: hypothetical protein PVF77_04730 [Anaerolineae bacterium]|jgi:hypothetical protein